MSIRRSIVLAALMVAAAGAALELKPTEQLAASRSEGRLDEMLPTKFGDWQSLPSAGIVVPDPQALANLERLYSEVVNRTYVNSSGQRIMLSIAYGRDQRDSMALHYPDVCYPSQGFMVVAKEIGEIRTSLGTIPVKRLEFSLEQRYEPVTYWAMIGDYPTLGGVDKKIAEMRYGLRGGIPDGLLFRVSSIDRDSSHAFHLHENFVSALLSVMTPGWRKRISGL